MAEEHSEGAENLRYPEDYFYYDKEHMKKVLDGTPMHIREAVHLGEEVELEGAFSRVFICGMGGSSIAGLLVKAYLGDIKTPIEVIQDYQLPAYCDGQSLVIVISYSGNTEEALSCFKDATRKTKNIVAITSGGKLEEYAETYRKQIINVPKNYAPRNALPFMFFPLLNLLAQAKIIESREQDITLLLQELNPQAIEKHGMALARKLEGKIPLIYASPRFYPIAYRWKTSFNENSKIHAFCHFFPELNHNETAGYAKLKGPYSLIILKTDEDFRRNIKRMELTKDLAKKAGVEVFEIMLKGRTLSKLFTAILMGDYISYYLALLNKIDPSPVMIIEKFKKELGPYV